MGHSAGTQRLFQRFIQMSRREEIRLTLERIRMAKKLVADQVEFIALSRAIGYEPIFTPTTLQRFRAQLSEQRAALVQLTRSGQEDFARRSEVSPAVWQRAA